MKGTFAERQIDEDKDTVSEEQSTRMTRRWRKDNVDLSCFPESSGHSMWMRFARGLCSYKLEPANTNDEVFRRNEPCQQKQPQNRYGDVLLEFLSLSLLNTIFGGTMLSETMTEDLVKSYDDLSYDGY